MTVTRGAGRGLAAIMAVALLLPAACGSDDASAPSTPTTTIAAGPAAFAVGLAEETFVDDTRSTPGNDEVDEQPDRTLVTQILYPAEGDGASSEPVEGAEPDVNDGPYPVVVFSHGLGGSFEVYQALLQGWAADGFVVVAPQFPRTYMGAEGGLDAADVQQQPGDVSFVLDQVIDGAAGDGPLAGMVDGEQIALAGHSNGAITTLGAVANSCCREPRADAAIVLSGADGPFADGEYDFTDTPPILWVHGTEDAEVSYDGAVGMFNRAVGPKGLLTMEGADHGDWLVAGATLDDVVAATTDFLDAELLGDAAAEARLADFDAPDTTLDWVPEEGSDTTIPTVPPPETDREVSADPTTDLADRQPVTVTWSGFLPDGTINIVQCSGDGTGGTAACKVDGNAYILQPNPTGDGSTTIDVVTGPVGDGVCDAAHPCVLAVNDSALSDPDAVIFLPLTFAG